MGGRSVGVPAGGFPLAPDFVLAVAPRGPGHLGREGVAGSLLFDTAGPGPRADLIARFFTEELDMLDWRADYMRCAELDDLIDGLDDRIEVETEIEEMYSKADLTTIGGDLLDGS